MQDLSSSDALYTVRFSKYSDDHHGSRFAQDFNGAWDVTRKALGHCLERIDSMAQTDRWLPIKQVNQHYLGYLRFAIAGEAGGALGANNKALVCVDDAFHSATVLALLPSDTDHASDPFNVDALIMFEFPTLATAMSLGSV
jgi:hypothetical protein